MDNYWMEVFNFLKSNLDKYDFLFSEDLLIKNIGKGYLLENSFLFDDDIWDKKSVVFAFVKDNFYRINPIFINNFIEKGYLHYANDVFYVIGNKNDINSNFEKRDYYENEKNNYVLNYIKNSNPLINKEDIKEIYRKFLNKIPTNTEIHFLKQKKLSEFFDYLISSAIFQERIFTGIRDFDNIEDLLWDIINKSFYVFLHPKKCAGSSLHLMLSKSFGQQIDTYSKNCLIINPFYWVNKQYARTHLDYDTVNHFMHGKKIFFTIIRNPFDRFLSQYYFRKNVIVKTSCEILNDINRILTQTNSLKNFLQHKEVYDSPVFYNHLTYIIAGRKKWQEWKNFLNDLKKEERNLYIETQVKPFIKNRINEFLFVGIQEDFETSCKILFNLINKTYDKVEKVNVTSDSIKERNLSPFDKEKITKDISLLIEEFIEIDKIVYEIGVQKFEQQKRSII